MDRERPKRRPTIRSASAAKLAIQLVGFLIGMALLAWALQMAFSAENQDQFKKLSEAPWHQVAALVLLSLGTLVINGLVFFVTLLPVRRLGVIDLQAISAIASLLSYMPFKMSLILRTVFHNRHDGVPLFTIAAWFAAIGVLIPAFVAPVIGASALRREVDLLWMVIAFGGAAVFAAIVVSLARLFGPGSGVERLERLADATRIRSLSKFVRSESFTHLHTGVVMLSSVRVVASNAALRLTDLALYGIRFKLAATMLGVDLSWSHAIVSGAVYFLIGASAPTGSLGVREGGTIGLAVALGIATTDAQQANFAAIALLVTAGELAAFLIGTAGGIVWLNPLKLARLGRDMSNSGADAGANDEANA